MSSPPHHAPRAHPTRIGPTRPCGPGVPEQPSGSGPTGPDEPGRWVRLLRSVDLVPVCCVVALTAVVQLWLIGLWRADPREMTDLGLTSLLGWATVASLLLLTASFFFALVRRAGDLVLGAHLLTLILLVHGTPAVLFGTLRYAWAWKHLGIVDYILRHGRVDTAIENLGVYHNWPGFFGASAFLADLAGPANLIEISIWAPVAFNVANLLALRYLFRACGADRLRTWLALVFFFITTWVGQDYFSPQALGYLLFLVLIATVLRYFRRPTRLLTIVSSGRLTAVPLLLVTLLLVAIAASHQITPMVAFLTLLVLFVFRQIRGWYLPVIALLAMAGWALTVAQTYTLVNFADLLSELSNPLANAGNTFEKSATIRGAQYLVSFAGRAVIIIVVLVAIVGVIRMARRRQLDRAMLLLMLTPGMLLFLTAFGGELLFRIFLFASPFLSYFAAAALTVRQRAGVPTRPWRAALPPILLTTLLIPLFLLAYYGKDQQNYFTPAEVTAGRWIADNTVPGTLLVRANTNYPHDFHNYEYVRNVAISAEDEPDRQRLLADPAGVLQRWLDDPANVRAFVLITRGQKIANDSVGPMPPGAVQHVEDVLSASPLFTEAYRNEDAVVFVLAEGP
jgi:hypothetical protein